MITSVFGISIKYEAWNQQDSLPVYIAGSYNFRTAYIGNKRCIILIPTEELVTLPALKKQITKIQQVASYGMQEKRDLHYLLLNGRRIEKR